MGIIIHSKILIGMLLLAAIFFVIGTTTFVLGVIQKSQPLATSSPRPQLPEINTPVDTLILTPVGTVQDIKIGKDETKIYEQDIQFSLYSVPNDWNYKATLKIFQKEIVGDFYKNNKIKVLGVGDISTNEKLEWKEIDVTEKMQRLKARGGQIIVFNLSPTNQQASGKTSESTAIFDGVAQLVVNKI